MKGIIFNVTQNAHLSRPLGGHRIAHYLRDLGWDVEVVDWANHWTFEELQQFAKIKYDDKLLFIGFSQLFSHWDDTLEKFGAWFKSCYPHVPILCGSSVNPMYHTDVVDYYFQGFSENALLVLLKYLYSNGSKPKFKFGDKKIISANDHYPAYPLESLMVKYEDRDYINSDEWLTIEFSRGCKFRCSYCNFPILGVKGDYSRSQNDFKEQLDDAYDRFGCTNYLISDETFNDRTEKIKKFADVVETLNYDTWFSGYIRADLLVSRKEDKEHLLRMNFLGQYYGIESFNHQSAKAVGKGLNSDKLKQGLIDSKKYFLKNGSQRYRGHISLICGLPHETKKSTHESFDWCAENWNDQAFSMFPLLVPRDNGLNIVSKFTTDFQKYGYELLSPNEIDSTRPVAVETEYTKGIRQLVVEMELWKNKDMNIYDAVETVQEVYKKRDKIKFMPGPWALGYRLKKNATVDDRLKLDFTRLDALLDDKIENYKIRKLGV